MEIDPVKTVHLVSAPKQILHHQITNHELKRLCAMTDTPFQTMFWAFLGGTLGIAPSSIQTIATYCETAQISGGGVVEVCLFVFSATTTLMSGYIYQVCKSEIDAFKQEIESRPKYAIGGTN